jgi:hypothetical protein
MRTEAGPCVHAYVCDKGVRQVAPRAVEVDPRRGRRPEFHGDEASEISGDALFRIEHVGVGQADGADQSWRTILRRELLTPTPGSGSTSAAASSTFSIARLP